MDATLRLDSKIETVYRKLDAKIDAVHHKLDAKIDRRCDEILSHTNEYANKTDFRLSVLEAAHA